jgi:hypothetical protein
VQEFLSTDNRYVSDHTREQAGTTFFPEGWLRRLR